jgi:hypothetical protein
MFFLIMSVYPPSLQDINFPSFSICQKHEELLRPFLNEQRTFLDDMMIWVLLNGFVGTSDKLVAGITQEQVSYADGD